MEHDSHHLFFSYSRLDNVPRTPGGKGWITAFKERLEAQHLAWCGRKLVIFCDTDEIDDGSDWRARLGRGLRTSRLFLAFFSPNYLRSPNCRWEWTEYLRREHTLARGDDGIATVYFVTAPGLPDPGHADEAEAAGADLRADAEIARWLGEIEAELTRRQLYLDGAPAGARRVTFDLRPWFPKGSELLAELDAAERLEELRRNPRADEHGLLTLAERLEALDRHVAARLDRALLAELAPGNIDRSYDHFVGRHSELRQLRDVLMNERRMGLLAAVHGLGGQGKTALAVQYAYAYAEFYAAGGRWLVPCEGKQSLSTALLELAAAPGLGLTIPDEERPDPVRAAKAVLHGLHAYTTRNASLLADRVRASTDRHSPPEVEPFVHDARALIILDNVDQPELLAADQIALLPRADWLDVIVTTRGDPRDFDRSSLGKIPVDSLPIEDAVALIRAYQPEQRFGTEGDEDAARLLATALGGFTLPVELVAAFLGRHPEVGIADFHHRLETRGLGMPDRLPQEDAAVARDVRHREKQLGLVLDATIEQLSPEARTVLVYACLLPPDFLVVEWLRDLAATEHPGLVRAERGELDPWVEVWRQLVGLRLLTAGQHADGDTGPASGGAPPRLARIHRLTAAHVAAGLSEQDRVIREEAIVARIDAANQRFEAAWRDDPRENLWVLRPLEEAALHALERSPGSRRLAMACGVAAQAELEIGLLARAEPLLERVSLEMAKRHAANRDDEDAARLASVAMTVRGDFFVRRGQAGDAERALGLFQRSLQIAERLARNNPGSAQATRDLSISLSKLGDFFLSRGQAGDAERALEHFQRSLQIREASARDNPSSAQAARDLSVSLNNLGDFFLARGQAGDAQRTLEHFQRCHQTLETIARDAPGSAQAARDLSLSLNKLGDFLLRRGQAGDAERALEHFQSSLHIAERLARDNPGSTQAARDRSVSLNRLGDFFVRRGQAGDAERALEHFQCSLQIAERLVRDNPGSAQAARDLSVSLNKLGDFFLRRGQAGDVERALEHFQRSLQVRETIAGDNPASAQAARDLSVSLIKLGDFFLRRGQNGDTDRALGHFRMSLQIAERLARDNPSSAQAAHDLSVSLIKLGDLLLRREQDGDAERAIEHFQSSLQIAERLARDNPGSAQVARELSVSLNRLGYFFLGREQAGDTERALGYFQRSLEIDERLVRDNPGSAQAARDLSVSHSMLARLRSAAGDGPGAAVHLTRCFEILDSFAREGRPMDPQMRAMHAQLAPLFRRG